MKGTINGSRGATARRGGAPRAAQARPTQPLAQGWLSTVEIRTPAGTPWLDAGGAVRPGCGAGRDLSVDHELLLQHHELPAHAARPDPERGAGELPGAVRRHRLPERAAEYIHLHHRRRPARDDSRDDHRPDDPLQLQGARPGPDVDARAVGNPDRRLVFALGLDAA